MRDPVFTQTMQIGIVVRDLGATMRKYVDEYGIGPWKIYEFNPGNATDLREYGQPVKRSWRLVKAPAWVPARALALLFLTVESFSVTASLPFVYFQL